ncbi:MAG: hypothetical protein VKJ64_22190, partial [Leptolyngbyaceae bacterium]|nr:hypothetical protein [Leptolyngbyaceae bacterium]
MARAGTGAPPQRYQDRKGNPPVVALAEVDEAGGDCGSSARAGTGAPPQRYQDRKGNPPVVALAEVDEAGGDW